MFHLIHGKIKKHHQHTYIENDLFGIEVTYQGKEKKGTFFLYPQIDQNHQTVRYYAFDKQVQKTRFEQMTKIQGIGSKNGYHLAVLPHKEVEHAVQSMDVKYFQSIPVIGPKTAKRVVLELKQSITSEDLSKINIDEKLFKDIVDSLKSLGYERSKVKKLLPDCPLPLTQEELPNIMKRLIDHL